LGYAKETVLPLRFEGMAKLIDPREVCGDAPNPTCL